MSRDLLETAFEKTKEIEKQEMKTRKLAETIGHIAGVSVAIALDSAFVWLVVKFLLGVSAFTWLNALGVMLLVNILYVKFKSS